MLTHVFAIWAEMAVELYCVTYITVFRQRRPTLSFTLLLYDRSIQAELHCSVGTLLTSFDKTVQI